MCLTLKTLIPIPHFTLWKSKKVAKWLYYNDNNKVYYTPCQMVIIPDNGILTPDIKKRYDGNYNSNFYKPWAFSLYDCRFLISGGYIHCYDSGELFDIDNILYEAEIPPFTLYFKGNDHDIACKKLIVHTDKPIKYYER